MAPITDLIARLSANGGDGSGQNAQSFQEAMVPLLDLIARLSPHGGMEVVGIHTEDQGGKAIVTVQIPVVWDGSAPKGTEQRQTPRL